MNKIKQIIQKEEYIALAINKYISQTAKIPKKSDKTLDWDKLTTKEYLGANFNKKNPLTSQDLNVVFNDTNNSFYIKSISSYNNKYKFLYSFYTNEIFRVNTLSPINSTKDELLKGSKIKYGKIQKQIVNASKTIKLSYETCPKNSEFYEYSHGKLTLKYCKNDETSFNVFQKEPIYTQSYDNLSKIKAKIGTKAYINTQEYYFNGTSWIPTIQNNQTSSEDIDIEKFYKIAQPLILRYYGGCYLDDGDVFCWGDNTYFQAGIQNTDIKWINTPIKLQVDSSDDIKFIDIARNQDNVCAISTTNKLYCNGKIANLTENKAKLTLNTKFNSLELISVAMLEKTMVAITKNKEVYSVGSREYGLLGLGSWPDIAYPKKIDSFVSGETFDKVYALTSSNQFVITGKDSTGNSILYLWGKHPFRDSIQTTPSKISPFFNKLKVGANTILVEETEDTYEMDYLKSKTTKYNAPKARDISGYAKSEALTDRNFLYIDENKKLQVLDDNSKNNFLTCKNEDATNCDANEIALFNNTLAILNADNQIGDISYALFSNIGIYQGKKIIIYANDDYYSLDGKTELTGDVSLNDKVLTNSELKYRIKTTPNNVTITLDNKGKFTYSPNSGCQIYNSFEYEIIDSNNIPLVSATAHIYDKKLGESDGIYSNDFQSSSLSWGVRNRCYNKKTLNGKCEAGNPTNIPMKCFKGTDLRDEDTVTSNWILGKFGNYQDSYNTRSISELDYQEQVKRTFYFGRENANKKVTLSFYFVKIDAWNNNLINKNFFKVFIDGTIVHNRAYSVWKWPKEVDPYIIDPVILPDGRKVQVKDEGIDLSKGYKNMSDTETIQYFFKYDLYHKFTIETTLKQNGSISLGFGAYLNWAINKGLASKGYGIDDINIKVEDYETDTSKIKEEPNIAYTNSPPFICTSTGFEDSSKLYCWGEVGNALPYINTSLYKNEDTNNLFFNDSLGKIKSNLFLKYPTFIGNFNNPIYFK